MYVVLSPRPSDGWDTYSRWILVISYRICFTGSLQEGCDQWDNIIYICKRDMKPANN